MIKVLAGAVAVTLAGLGSAQAATVFADDFDSEMSDLNASPANWTVSDGTVDVIGDGYYDLYAGNGHYLDLDGSSRDAGTITTNASFDVEAGQSYTLSFEYGRNFTRRGTETLAFGFGGWSDELTIASDALSTYSVTFTAVASGLSSLFFSAGGFDNNGAVIDDVVLSSIDVAPVPLPAAGLLLAGALGAVALTTRRRRAA